ncbi:MAG TPA: hypothetical protein VGN88_09430 [Phycisphaerae bacterium]|jgi:hypothetical protein
MNTRHSPLPNYFESLESRQLLSGLPVFPLPAKPAFVVDRGGSDVYLGTLPNANFTIPGDAGSHGPDLHVTINWGDGVTSTGDVQRNAKGKIEVWGSHTYLQRKSFPVTVSAAAGDAPLRIAFKTTATVVQNSQRGRTIKETVEASFADTVVATIDRPAGFPKLTLPVSTLTLPDGLHTAAIQIDWGDGTVTPGTIVSKNGNYDVRGSHSYVTAGPYRIVVFVVVTAISDGSVTALTTLSSTALVSAAGTHPNFNQLPGHSAITYANVVPSAFGSASAGGVFNFETNQFQLTVNNGTGSANTGTSSGSTGSIDIAGSLNINGGVNGGVLHLGGGAGSITVNQGNNGAGTLTLGTVVLTNSGIFTSGGGTIGLSSGLLNGTHSSGTGTVVLGSTGGVLTIGTGNNSLLISQYQVSQGIFLNYVPTGDLYGPFLGLYGLADPHLAFNLFHALAIHADGTLSLRLSNGTLDQPMTGQQTADYIASHDTASYVFNLSTPADMVASLLQNLPADFTGDIVLPAGVDLTLADRPGATFLHPTYIAPLTGQIIVAPPVILNGNSLSSGLTFNNTAAGMIEVVNLNTPTVQP